jgi:hypothetical protein
LVPAARPVDLNCEDSISLPLHSMMGVLADKLQLAVKI